MLVYLLILYHLVATFIGIFSYFNSKKSNLLRYEFFKIFFAGYSTYYGFTSTVSFFAGIVATTMVNPFWVINARMAISKVFLSTKFHTIIFLDKGRVLSNICKWIEE